MPVCQLLLLLRRCGQRVRYTDALLQGVGQAEVDELDTAASAGGGEQGLGWQHQQDLGGEGAGGGNQIVLGTHIYALCSTPQTLVDPDRSKTLIDPDRSKTLTKLRLSLHPETLTLP